MKLESILELKETFKKEYKNKVKRDKHIAQTENVFFPNPEIRLSIGYSEKNTNDFVLKFRVQKEGSFAHSQALKFKEKARGEADIGIISKIEVPFVSTNKKLREIYRKYIKNPKPLHLGSSVGHANSGSGSLGVFIQNKNGHDGFLSCCHVLALCGNAREKDFVYHPGRTDKIRLTHTDRVGQLENFNVFSVHGNDIDCAYATILANVNYEGNIIPKFSKVPANLIGQRLGPLVTSNQITGLDTVAKIGKSSGYSEGFVNAKDLDDIMVEMPSHGSIKFHKLMEIRGNFGNPFTLPGDSGSLVFMKNGLSPFGIHFASGFLKEDGRTFKVSYCCDLQDSLNTLNVSLL